MKTMADLIDRYIAAQEPTTDPLEQYEAFGQLTAALKTLGCSVAHCGWYYRASKSGFGINRYDATAAVDAYETKVPGGTP